MTNSDLDFVSDMLVQALQERREDLVPRLFKLYDELKNPPTIPGISTSDYNFNLSSEYLTELNNNVAIGGLNDDVISFGDYKSWKTFASSKN